MVTIRGALSRQLSQLVKQLRIAPGAQSRQLHQAEPRERPSITLDRAMPNTRAHGGDTVQPGSDHGERNYKFFVRLRSACAAGCSFPAAPCTTRQRRCCSHMLGRFAASIRHSARTTSFGFRIGGGSPDEVQ